jgi:hypothetical protein
MTAPVGFAKPKPRPAGYDPYQDVERAQQLSMEGVEGYGEALKPHLLREIGTALGGLNEIGALRSGGANVALSDISTNYAQQIGAYAKQASGNALGYGLEAQRIRQERQRQKDAKKGGLLKAIGGVLGAGVGFLVGGPAGAVAGASIGGSAGASDANYTPSEGAYT